MKKLLFFSFLYFIFIISFAQDTPPEELDSLKATLKDLSWQKLDSLGKFYTDEYELDKAELYLKEALQVAERDFGKDSLYLNSCRELGILYFYKGEYEKVENFWMKEKQITEQLYGKENLNYGKLCNNLAALYKTKGQYEKAEALYLEARHTIKKLAGKQHSDYASSCNSLATLYDIQGKHKQAEVLYKEAMEVIAELTGKEDTRYGMYCNNLAETYAARDMFQQAETLFLEAKDIFKITLGNQHPYYATSCESLANLYHSQGLYKKAEPLFLENKQIIETLLGKEHSKYASACINFANNYYSKGLYEQAELLYREAKDIKEKILGKEHPDYASACANLATVMVKQSLYDKAEALDKEAKEIREKVFGKKHSHYATSCRNLGTIYHKQKLYEKAEPLYLESKKIIEEVLGKEHIDYTTSCYNLALLYQDQGLYEKANLLFSEVSKNIEQGIKVQFPTFSESERQEHFENVKYYYTDFTEFATRYYSQNPKISQELFNQQLFTKGIIFSSVAKMKKQILASEDAELLSQYENWKQQKENYIKLIQSPISERDSTMDLKKLAFQINELEREISKKSEFFKENIQRKDYTWIDAKESLDKDEVIVELMRLEKKDIKGNTKDIVYVALILSKKTKKHPELLVLENGKELEKEGFAFYENSIEFQLEDTESYALYWKPIQDKLKNLSKKGYSKIYLSADGVYQKLSLGALLNPKTEKYITEEQNIQLITSSRDLIKRKKEGGNTVDLSKNFANYKAYLLGYPSYKLVEEDSTIIKDKNRALNGIQRVIGQQTEVIPVLEGTKIETDRIKSLFNKKEISVALFQKQEANEANVKSVQSPTILHFATHGFFINQIQNDKVTTMQEAEDRNLLQNPLLRSGLLLAGCQNPQLGEEDGVLSAEEAMNLNLKDTELVVLSACETGLGEIRNGEGVYGLQRAFRQAGAKTVIMSLWQVNDESTQLLMTYFYEQLLQGKSKREAFKAAQLQLKEKYKSPYYWGAFVVVGE
ncbi:MAG: hypothetical protein COZ18_15545 [Flexibacter sp. CG_4_10_14_3_um_filter_32_15]|nr:MAG: hypothetical protein COZ18_15545 [Flexibacter sp. CG_4_10_14_3_um_filter_32_15]